MVIKVETTDMAAARLGTMTFINDFGRGKCNCGMFNSECLIQCRLGVENPLAWPRCMPEQLH